MKRVNAPSCWACNQRLREVEEKVLVPLALALDPEDPRAAGVVQRVQRSMDPRRNRSARQASGYEASRCRTRAASMTPRIWRILAKNRQSLDSVALAQLDHSATLAGPDQFLRSLFQRGAA